MVLTTSCPDLSVEASTGSVSAACTLRVVKKNIYGTQTGGGCCLVCYHFGQKYKERSRFNVKKVVLIVTPKPRVVYGRYY